MTHAEALDRIWEIQKECKDLLDDMATAVRQLDGTWGMDMDERDVKQAEELKKKLESVEIEV